MSHRSRGAWIEIWASLCLPSLAVSRIAHAVRGLKSQLYLNALTKFTRRIAHAVRGLKFILDDRTIVACKSHRSRGAWIEITLGLSLYFLEISRIAHAVRGLKFGSSADQLRRQCRIAHAVRGLKSLNNNLYFLG